jgi:hypothetical protein
MKGKAKDKAKECMPMKKGAEKGKAKAKEVKAKGKKK